MKSNRGRKTRYNKSFPEQAEEMASRGLMNKDIAKNLGISIDSFCEYQNKYPEFAESLKRGRCVADKIVENALYKRAIGYEFEETSTSVKIGKDGQPEPQEVKKITKHIAADVTAQIFWLKNRNPTEWRDRHELTGKDGTTLENTATVIILPQNGRESESENG